VRQPTPYDSDFPTTSDQNENENNFPSTTEVYSSEDAQNRIAQLSQFPGEDQYSRDRYGDDKLSPQQGMDIEYQRSSLPDQSSESRPGDLVNSFECVINLSLAGQQQAHTAQWQTASCRPLHTNHME
jgi:hypothetical protein